MRGWQLVTAGVALAIILVDGASAAGLSVTTRTLGSTTVGTPRCATGAISVLPVLSGSAVASVTIASLPAACAGATARVTVNNGSATGSGSGTVPAGGGSLGVTIGGSPAVDANVQVDLVLEGP